MSQSTEAQNKAIVLEAFDTLFNKRDYDAGGALLVTELRAAQRPH
jgi:hypothetical protein